MKQLAGISNNKFPDLMIPAIEHKEAEDDDCGLPEDPIFSDYSKYLWKSHTRSGGVQRFTRRQENAV